MGSAISIVQKISFFFFLLLACIKNVSSQPGVFNVMNFGAKADGKTDDAKAILRAWTEACRSVGKSRVVLIPQGTYLAGPVLMNGPCKNSITFQLDGTVKAPFDMFGKTDWIVFKYINGLTVSGNGAFDGQGALTWSQNQCSMKAKGGKCTFPISLRFNFVTDATITGISSIDSKIAHMNIFACNNIKLQNIKISAPAHSLNTDGIHISTSNGVHISDSAIATGDDCVSIITGSNNVQVTGVNCGPGHGISIGSMGKSKKIETVTGITVKNCIFTDTDNGVRIKTWPAGSAGSASNLTFEDIIMNNVRNPIVIDQEYCPYKLCNKQAPSRIKISKVAFKNIRGTSATKEVVTLKCGMPCEDVELSDINLKYNGADGPATSALGLERKKMRISSNTSDVVSVVVGVFFCFAESLGKKRNKENLLQQPLLSSTSDSISIGLGEDIKGENSCPFSTASFFSILTFSWMSPLLAVGNEKTINLEDVPQLSRDDSVKVIFPIFRNKYDSYQTKYCEVSSFQLAKALLFSTRIEILWTGLLTLLHTCASYVGPYLINSFVQFLNSPQKSTNDGYILMSAFIVSSIVQGLSERQASFGLTRVGIRVHAALVAAIYSKLQTLSSQSRQVHSSGEIINLMAVDAGSVSNICDRLHDWWQVPIQIILALFVLYKNLRLASVAAFIATIIIMLANFPLGKYQNNLQVKLMKSKDRRMKTTSEILRNMKILKLQGWEMKFLSKIVELRENEEGWLKKFLYTAAISASIFNAGPALISVATFGACILMGFPLDSGKILSALATFRILKEAIFILPRTISMLAQTKVSLDRISSFLSLDDRQPDMIEQLPNSQKVIIEVNNGNFTWDSSISNSPTLKDLNFQVFRGMRVGVCGTVGSGKSSLLSCILGEMTKVSGNIRLNGTKAYVAQSPWIQSGNVQENILFGKEMDRDRYERVLGACSLKKDLTMLSFGDQTVIGERGINLSGGQKQRIQIARALYQDTDIYLFDDPFSALDAHTGMHVYKECLLGFLDSKTVIYTTNQVEYLPSADLILVVKNGSIIQSGVYSEILASGTDFEELVGAHYKAMLGHMNSGTGREGLASATVTNLNHEHGITGENESQIQHNSTNTGKETLLETQVQIVQEEEREKGRVGIGVYWDYITTAYGGALAPFIMVAQILYQSLQIASNYWIAWATPVSKYAKSPVEASTLIIVYIALVFGSCICVFTRATIVVTAGYKTATVLFTRMHLSIFRAPMSFFDATPSGRILNRASTDQNDVDWNIPTYMWGFAVTIITVLGAIFVMVWAAWQVCAIFAPVIVACFWYQKYYIAAARELVRLDGVCNAPLKQHFTESISGLTTIRSFAQENRFIVTNMKLIDSCLRPEFYSIGGMSWLGFRLDMLSSITFGLTLVFIISMPEGLVNPVIAGLAVTYGLNLNMLQAFLIWLLGILESKIISVERILQYTRIPNEPPLVIEAHRPNPSWPSHGEIAILNLQVRYAPHLPLILHGVTCTFPGGKKTGVVGRTGSGKSTLIQTLFRIVEPTSGEILIDGINISMIGLHDLRCKLSIIPQDPTMFEGTVRTNLDPLAEYTDEQIWEALDKCQLGDEVRKKQGKLDSPVAENGENWSMGQRQLVCLGRVVLKRSKILVLDEATSSVDTATDNLMQKTLKQHFSESTVITIAHRITSVLDSNLVLVLDNGQLVEYDSPNKLLKNKSSSFAKLVNEQVKASRM